MSEKKVNEHRARAYPAGDAQGQHPVSVGNGQGLLHHGRVRRKKRALSMKEIRMRYASWNVGTMTGKGRELADVLKRRRINIACLQETKWKGTRAREIGEGYKFYYSGGNGKRNGVGIVLDKNLKECVTNVKRVNDRLIVVKIVWESIILNVISAYAPQAGCKDEVKEEFWQNFDEIMIGIPESEEICIGGDFNGHVGEANDSYESVHGGWGYGKRNIGGETLLQVASSFHLAIANTWFQKSEEHLTTYKSCNHRTQIDYFLVKRSQLFCVRDCKVLPGEALVTQHRLLLLEMRIKTRPINTRNRPPPKIRWSMLERKEYASRFKQVVIDKMIEMNDMKDKSVNECWNEMASCIRNTAKGILGETKGKGIIDRDTWWWNEDVQQILKEKKNVFKEWQKENNERLKEAKKTEYKECKRKAKRAIATARAQAEDKIYKSLDGPQGQKTLYRITKAREERARDIRHIRCIKDETGQVLIKEDEIKERWKRYFERLMNEENLWSGVLDDVPENVGLIGSITIDEVREAVRSMKNGKSAGPDGIPVEVWKILEEDGYMWLTLFFDKLLHEEVIPSEWCNSTLVPIFKNKGDVQDCGSYRGIKLLSHSMKVWEKVIEKRLREESEITQNQFGFMSGRGATDAIFALRQLCEKYRGAHRNLHMVFVDLEKAYDRIPRAVLWWALKEKSVPVKYIRLICAMYWRSRSYVRSAVGDSDGFNVEVGLHQGSALSPYLFLLIMDALTSEIQEEAPWCMLFADDVVLVGEDGLEVQSMLEKWRCKLENVGLKISRPKTEYMFCDFGGLSNVTPIALDGVLIPVCSNFRYLGSLIQSSGDLDRAVKHRVDAGWMKWRQVTGTICDPRVPLKLKGKIYKTLIRPAVLYGSACWATKATDERRLHVAEMRMLRWMYGVTRMDKIRNERIRECLKVAPVTDKLRSERLSWYGHVMRRDESNVARKVLSMNVEGFRGKGRPKKRWMDCVKHDMYKQGVTTEMTSDRDVWKKRTYCVDPK